MTTYVDPGRYGQQVHAVEGGRDDEGAEEGLPDAPHPAEQADAADHRSSNGLESQVATPGRRGDRGSAGGEDDPAGGGQSGGEGEADQLDAAEQTFGASRIDTSRRASA